MVPMKKCRTCGKEYQPCHNTGNSAGVFRWREVACSPECGEIYLQEILESRGLAPKKDIQTPMKKMKSKHVEVEITDEPVVAEEVIANSAVEMDTLGSKMD